RLPTALRIMLAAGPRSRVAVACALGVAALTFAGAPGARFDAARVAVESPAVAARFPDPTIAYDTPGFGAKRDDFTSHGELMAFVTGLQARSGGFTLRIIGTSKEGRAIPLLVFASGTTASATAILKTGKPTVLIVAQQHGNEPAGSEAALVIAGRLAAGGLKAMLERINVPVVPRATPGRAAPCVR